MFYLVSRFISLINWNVLNNSLGTTLEMVFGPAGSEGKLTVTAQRLGMLTAVGNLSNNSVTGTSSVQSLSSTVVECFIPVLQQEGKQFLGIIRTVLHMAGVIKRYD